jgi:hypothetical protein
MVVEPIGTDGGGMNGLVGESTRLLFRLCMQRI